MHVSDEDMSVRKERRQVGNLVVNVWHKCVPIASVSGVPKWAVAKIFVKQIKCLRAINTFAFISLIAVTSNCHVFMVKFVTLCLIL